MELIRLYYGSVDIKPSVMIRHFARYLGLYVEENADTKNVGSSSLADIYIIGDEYFGDQDTVLDVQNEDRTILILKEGYSTDDTRVKTIHYSDDSVSDKDFLCELLETIYELVDSYVIGFPILLQSGVGNKGMTAEIVSAYLSNNIMQASLFNRCFYKEEQFYQMAVKHFESFITDVENICELFEENDLSKYMLIYAKYELNVICKKNHQFYKCFPDDLFSECKKLLKKYPRNEELYLLKADIELELLDRWLDACDSYANPRIAHCAYADYKRGKIFRAYLEEYDDAEYLLRRAVQRKKDYVYAWYQLGVCYEEQSKYQMAIKTFNKIVSILRSKYKRHLLAPLELEYMYKAVMWMAAIYKTRLGDYISAYAYNDLAESIRQENSIRGYVDQLWNSSQDMGGIDAFRVIDDTLKEKINLKLEEIY